MTPPQDTPRTDACPHCGADFATLEGGTTFTCGSNRHPDSSISQSYLCRERSARQKAEEQYLEMAQAASEVPDLYAEIKRLRDNLLRVIEIADDFNFICIKHLWHNEGRLKLDHKLKTLKATLTPTNK